MSSLAQVSPARWLWRGSELQQVENGWQTDDTVLAADSWLVTDGRVRALELHRERFVAACLIPRLNDPKLLPDPVHLAEFWAAMTAALPIHGDWFPKVELLRSQKGGAAELIYVLRSAPKRTRSVVVTSHLGADPRTFPTVKGPDLLVLAGIRAAVADRVGAEEAIILSPEGYLVEGAYSALVWWQGNELCVPPAGFARVDSVTSRALVTLAQALGVSVREESVRPGDLAERELWSLSALHGIRIVREWIGGPPLAELPGRLGTWRARLDRLAHPMVTLAR
ncbi:MAG: aminotransferase class IV [Microbacteriaceae bacterium]|nr:aminotransferase class IV [Microbacteriaceae bacterium]